MKCVIDGCVRDMQVKSTGLCAMHSQRLRRTGKVGQAGPFSPKGSQTKRGVTRATDALYDLVKVLGRGKWEILMGRGTVQVFSRRGRSNKMIGTQQLEGFRRRCWIKTRREGTKWIAELTAAGRTALRE